MTRFLSVEALEDGWLGDGSRAPQPELLGWVRNHLSDIAAAPCSTSIIPLSDGLISLVWDSTDREYTAELHDGSVTLYVDHLDSDEIEERELPLDWSAISAEMGPEA